VTGRRIRWRLTRLEHAIAPVNEEPTTIKVLYHDVNGEVVSGYEVVLPPRRGLGLPLGRQNRAGNGRFQQ
jgi:hypothetical protein